MDRPSISIVCTGGGMKCAYSAGALEAIYSHYKFTSPTVMIGASGAAGNCAYYLAGQPEAGIPVWVESLTDGQMVSFWRLPIINLQYLIYTVFTKRIPLQIDKVLQSETTLLIPVANTENGSPEYVSNTCKGVDFMKLLMAAKTLPGVAGRPIAIFSDSNKRYFDGDIAQQLNQHIKTAGHYNSDYTIIIDNQTVHSMGMKFFYLLQSLLSARGIRKATRRGIKDSRQELPEDESLIYLKPSSESYMHGLSDQKKKVARLYQMGYDDMIRNQRIQALLGK